MSWLKHPIELEGEHVKLLPLEEKYFPELIEAGKEEIIWTYMPARGFEADKLTGALRESLALREKGEQYPFVVIDKLKNKVIGSTRYLKITEEFRNLEIGWTWYRPEYWASGYNEECKLLLLTHCFETLKTVRVQIVAAEKNARSRKAILRIGATFEGVLRHIVIRNGEKRSAAYYSILEEEWEKVKADLDLLRRNKIKTKNNELDSTSLEP